MQWYEVRIQGIRGGTEDLFTCVRYKMLVCGVCMPARQNKTVTGSRGGGGGGVRNQGRSRGRSSHMSAMSPVHSHTMSYSGVSHSLSVLPAMEEPPGPVRRGGGLGRKKRSLVPRLP